jgi:hypothetical protein
VAGVDGNPNAVSLQEVASRLLLRKRERMEFVEVLETSGVSPSPDHVKLNVHELDVIRSNRDPAAQVDLRPSVRCCRYPVARIGYDDEDGIGRREDNPAFIVDVGSRRLHK